jgi:hypothetical protein
VRLLVFHHYRIKKLSSLQQLVSVASLHYPPLIEHHNLIKVHCGQQLVHNSYDRLIPELLSNYPLDELLGTLIDIRGGFIYDEYCFFGEENTGETDELHLSRAQTDLIVFNGGI